MSNELPEYPHQPSVFWKEKNLTVVHPPKPQPNRWLIIWKYFRKLIRQRQFRKAFRQQENKLSLAELHFDKVMQTAQKQIDQLKEDLASRNREILTLREADIPRLERQLEVEKSYAEYLAALHEKELSRVEAVIAVENTRMEDQRNIRSMMRNSE